MMTVGLEIVSAAIMAQAACGLDTLRIIGAGDVVINHHRGIQPQVVAVYVQAHNIDVASAGTGVYIAINWIDCDGDVHIFSKQTNPHFSTGPAVMRDYRACADGSFFLSNLDVGSLRIDPGAFCGILERVGVPDCHVRDDTRDTLLSSCNRCQIRYTCTQRVS